MCVHCHPSKWKKDEGFAVVEDSAVGEGSAKNEVLLKAKVVSNMKVLSKAKVVPSLTVIGRQIRYHIEWPDHEFDAEIRIEAEEYPLE